MKMGQDRNLYIFENKPDKSIINVDNNSMIASSSMATELIKGKTLEEAWELTNKAVAEALDGLPPVKMHCSVLAEDAVHKAINSYRISVGLEPWDFHEHEDIHEQVHGVG